MLLSLVELSALDHLTSELLRTFKWWSFQANILVVWAIEHRFPLSLELGALADGLGCFLSTTELIPRSLTATL